MCRRNSGKFWVAGGGVGGSGTGLDGDQVVVPVVHMLGGDGIHQGQAMAVINTGGGGGGTGNAPPDGSTQPGGSGIVLIAYQPDKYLKT